MSDQVISIDPIQAGINRFNSTQATVEKNQGAGSKAGELALATKHLKSTSEAVKSVLETLKDDRKAKGTAEFLEAVEPLDPDVLALCCISAAISRIARADDFNSVTRAVAMAIQNEAFAYAFQNKDKDAFMTAQKAAKRRQSMTNRRAVNRIAAKKAEIVLKPWTGDLMRACRSFAASVMLTSGVFKKGKRLSNNENGIRTINTLELTEESLAFIHQVQTKAQGATPIPFPQNVPFPDWDKSFNLHVPISGDRFYRIPMMRLKGSAPADRAIKAALKAGTMTGVVEALNNLQRTAWSINEPVYELVKWAFDTNQDIEEFVTSAMLPKPDKVAKEVFETWDQEQKRVHRSKRRRIDELNRSRKGSHITWETDQAIIDNSIENGNVLYFPYNLDWRGRVYTASYFGFQRQDHIRGLFRFAEGSVLSDEGYLWLLVHTANCMDAKDDEGNKVSKKSFNDRLAWAEANIEMLNAIGEDPKGTIDLWRKADAPFQFVAACMEIANANRFWNADLDYYCALPVSFDGSCSGLQHLCMMTGAVEGHLVNLTPQDQPSDVYQTVADLLEPKVRAIAADDAHEAQEVAQKILIAGINRSLVKRSVMTYAYSSQERGMQEQFSEDTMQPLADKVVTGELSVHPYAIEADVFKTKKGNEFHKPGAHAARFLGSMVYDTIQEVVQKPAEAMQFLQKLSAAPSHEGKAVTWHTPLGLPVILQRNTLVQNQTVLWLHDKGVRKQTTINNHEPTTKINKNKARSAIAPCFVHSLDACHLMMAVNACALEGINLAVVHDSFGCLPSQAAQMRGLLLDTLYRLYTEHDPLKDIYDETYARLETSHKMLPPLPEKGSLDRSQVLHSLYAFG